MPVRHALWLDKLVQSTRGRKKGESTPDIA